MASDELFSGQLEAWLRTNGTKTVGSLADLFGERSFAVTILFLMFVPALPLPTGGVTHVFEVIAIACSDPGFENRTTVVIMAQVSISRSHRRIRINCISSEMKVQTVSLRLAQVKAVVSGLAGC